MKITVTTDNEKRIFRAILEASPTMVAKASYMEYGIGMRDGRLIWLQNGAKVSDVGLEGEWDIFLTIPKVTPKTETKTISVNPHITIEIKYQ